MLQSLRARLAFLFAGTLVLATVIAAVVVVSLYKSYNRDQTVNQLRTQVGAVARYYQNYLNRQFGNGGKTQGVNPTKRPPTPASVFEKASAANLYEASSVPLFPANTKTLQDANISLNLEDLKPGSRPVFPEFTPQGETRTFIGVGAPILIGDQPVGAVVLARPLADVNNAWKNIIGLVGVGLAVGLAVALILATYVARRITQPLRVIGGAADKVARGDLDVNVIGRRTSDDELGQL
ncbi:MAG TPA: HAMP domain-containing protein, partial [Gaiellales bacterium]